MNSLYPMPRPVIGCAASAAAYIASIRSSDRLRHAPDLFGTGINLLGSWRLAPLVKVGGQKIGD